MVYPTGNQGDKHTDLVDNKLSEPVHLFLCELVGKALLAQGQLAMTTISKCVQLAFFW